MSSTLINKIIMLHYKIISTSSTVSFLLIPLLSLIMFYYCMYPYYIIRYHRSSSDVQRDRTKHSVSVFVSRDPLYRSPPAPQRTHARATPTSHVAPPCLRRHNGGRFPTRRAGSVKSLSGDNSRSPPEVGESSESANPHPTQLYCYCCIAGCVVLRWGLVGTYCCTAVVVLWWVGRWVGGGLWVLGGGGSLVPQDRSPRWRGFVKQNNLPTFLTTS